MQLQVIGYLKSVWLTNILRRVTTRTWYIAWLRLPYDPFASEFRVGFLKLRHTWIFGLRENVSSARWQHVLLSIGTRARILPFWHNRCLFRKARKHCEGQILILGNCEGLLIVGAWPGQALVLLALLFWIDSIVGISARTKRLALILSWSLVHRLFEGALQLVLPRLGLLLEAAALYKRCTLAKSKTCCLGS